ncbi:rho GTPase-activating protein REN1 isoform X2 [Mercurialis annua]|uniref:rho GTPase-activating protein REN1 isoform X2 n=1 Tax=Mercurialis annua TaxID=3986 RepID=UPI0021606212|nr:rho GTPase-activating protein REN1 isoform X2 [Mercurialis annua]
MTNKSVNTDLSQGDGCGGGACGPPPPGQPDNAATRAGNTVFKSGPLFISSKGIGWTSWKKRWFILTRTSLVFFRSDPSAVPQRGSEVNLTLGGIDLNNSGSVVVKSDKKLLTVLFPDGRDGRAFTLKAETMEDLYEWKTALENALSQAPSAALMMGQNGIFKNDQADCVEGSFDQCVLPVKEKVPMKALVIGRPVLLALEDVDGSPSFLEKALKFIEEHGVKVEGILRQAAAVDDVERRVREYEQGKTEFSEGEDAHVIADCVKYFLRELPSSPVPASCCNALLEAFRKSVAGKDRGNRVNAMREAILETFPEPNRRLLERILLMMQTVASHKAENRMSTSAVAACMAPLLLRPLLAGDCEIEHDFDVGGDGSMQLLQAAAAANHAQAIVITLMEEYDSIFNDDIMSSGLYSDSEECNSEDEEVTDDDESYEDDERDDRSQESEAYTEDDLNDASSGNGNGDSGGDEMSDNKGHDDPSSGSTSPKLDNDFKVESSNSVQNSLPSQHGEERSENVLDESNHNLATQIVESHESSRDLPRKTTLEDEQTTSISSGRARETKPPNLLGRNSGRKDLSVESLDYAFDEEVEIQKLEAAKIDLQQRISEEVKSNEVLQASLEQRKKSLHERRLALAQDVTRLQEELQRERDKRIVLETGLDKSQGSQTVPVILDEKIKADIEEISQAEAEVSNLKQKVDDLSKQLNQQHDQNHSSLQDSNNQARKDKQRDIEASSSSHLGKSANKWGFGIQDTLADESISSVNKNSPQNQQPDAARSSNSRSSSNSRKSSYRSEGANSTTSALTKLTTRLNFLKERRSQLTSEILDKGRGSSHVTTNKARGSEVRQTPQNQDKSHNSEVHSVSNSDRSRGSESSQTETPSRKSLESQNPDKGKADGSGDKGKGSGSQGSRRTNSR